MFDFLQIHLLYLRETTSCEQCRYSPSLFALVCKGGYVDKKKKKRKKEIRKREVGGWVEKEKEEITLQAGIPLTECSYVLCKPCAVY